MRHSGSDPRAASSHYAPERRPRWGTLALVVLLHLAALAGLVRAFAPDLTAEALDAAASLVTVDVTAPDPPPPPPPPAPEPAPSPAPDPRPEEGAAAPPGPTAVPRETVLPQPALAVARPTPAPRASSTGRDTRSGAAEAGEGTGAGGEGSGTGSGRSGSGQGAPGGGMPVTQPEKIAGDINDARDYPVPAGGREIRRGQEVIVYMTVGVDGRARDCRVARPSPDPEADRITCRLAEERFRFRPARDANGNPVAAPYGWRQRWF